MTDTPKCSCECEEPRAERHACALRDWFVREVLPVEADLMQFLRRHRHAGCDVNDLRQETYLRVYESALERLPQSARALVFTIARNILVDRFRRERITPLVGLPDSDFGEIPSDEPGPDRRMIARDELKHVYAALDRLPPRAREAVVLRGVDHLSRRESAKRMGIAEKTVDSHLQNGLRLLVAMFHSE